MDVVAQGLKGRLVPCVAPMADRGILVARVAG